MYVMNNVLQCLLCPSILCAFHVKEEKVVPLSRKKEQFSLVLRDLQLDSRKIVCIITMCTINWTGSSLE